MKKLIFLIAVIVTLTTCIAATIIDYPATHKTGDVNVYEAVSVFTDSTPVLPYDIMGDLHVGSSGGLGNDSYTSQRDAAIKKLKKQFPTADGILISFKGNGACNATAIKFK